MYGWNETDMLFYRQTYWFIAIKAAEVQRRETANRISLSSLEQQRVLKSRFRLFPDVGL